MITRNTAKQQHKERVAPVLYSDWAKLKITTCFGGRGDCLLEFVEFGIIHDVHMYTLTLTCIVYAYIFAMCVFVLTLVSYM